MSPLSQLKEFLCCSQFSWPHHQGTSVLLGAWAPGLGCSQQSTGRSEAAISLSFADCVTFMARIVLTLVSVLQARCSLCQFLISAFLKHATVNTVCQDAIFVLCKCVYLWFTEELKLLCTFPLSSLYLSSPPPVFLQSIFSSKEFGVFPLTGGNKQFRAKICFLRETCRKASFL